MLLIGCTIVNVTAHLPKVPLLLDRRVLGPMFGIKG